MQRAITLLLSMRLALQPATVGRVGMLMMSDQEPIRAQHHTEVSLRTEYKPRDQKTNIEIITRAERDGDGLCS